MDLTIDITENPVRGRGVGKSHRGRLSGTLVTSPGLQLWVAMGTAEQKGFQVVNCRINHRMRVAGKEENGSA